MACVSADLNHFLYQLQDKKGVLRRLVGSTDTLAKYAFKDKEK